MTIGELVAFNMLAGRVAQPVLRLAQIWQDFHQARISIDRLGDILNTPPEPHSRPAARLPTDQGTIASSMSLSLPVDGPESSARHQCRSIPAGPGGRHRRPSGSGKSTLAKLVQRLYVPESGRCWSTASILRWSMSPGCGADRRRAAGKRAVQPLHPREHRACRSRHADGARHRGGQARRRA
jgi:ABC-type protease/lipase transport system fused ATPase/permease subunit